MEKVKPRIKTRILMQHSKHHHHPTLIINVVIIINNFIIIVLIKMASPAPSELPADFGCPITKQLMKEPVFSRYGHHFERSAILQHIEAGNPFCPITGNPLGPSDLIPNKSLQWKIKYWAKMNGLETAAEPDDAAKKVPQTTDLVDFVAVPVPPARFHCPLTRKIMKVPIMTKDGINFERHAIMKWLHSSPEGICCPVTAKPLSRCGLVSNSMLQREIEEWEQRYGGNVQSKKDESKKNLGEVATIGSSSSSLKYSSGSKLFPRDLISSLPTDLYSTDNTTRIKYLRRDKKSVMDALDSAYKIQQYR
jgi:hypothetical protein